MSCGYASRARGRSNWNRPPQLLLYSEIMGVYAEEVAALEARLRTVKAGCFGPVREVSANLTTQEDVYPLAANRMFYKLLEGFFVLKRHDYMLYMEVDTVPVRRLWLDAISMLIPPFSEPFWLKGSAPCANLTSHEDVFLVCLLSLPCHSGTSLLPTPHLHTFHRCPLFTSYCSICALLDG